jgi:hypothetical protein
MNLTRRALIVGLWFVGGTAYGLYYQSVVSAAHTSRQATNDWPIRTITAWRHFSQALIAWPWNLLAACLLLGLIVALRFKRSAWGPAFVLGALIGAIVGRLAIS